jgi:starch synthase
VPEFCRAREEVRKRVNMSQWQDKPIVAVVSRLTPQKGVHLIKHAAYKVSWAHTRM